MPRGRKKKEVTEAVAEAPVVRSEKSGKSIEQVYAQLATLLKKNKVSKRDLAQRLEMSYQGFLNSYNKRNLRMETWHEIADYLNIPFVSRFDLNGKLSAAPAVESAAPAAAPVPVAAVDNSFTAMRLENAEQKITILERQITSLENQLNDKQTIIHLMTEKSANK